MCSVVHSIIPALSRRGASFGARCEEEGVTFLTSRNIDAFLHKRLVVGDTVTEAVVTIGLSKPKRVGSRRKRSHLDGGKAVVRVVYDAVLEGALAWRAEQTTACAAISGIAFRSKHPELAKRIGRRWHSDGNGGHGERKGRTQN